MVVQHNLTAMNSNRMLGLTTKTQAKSTEKLSSGYKINRAADDAAGLSISEKMRKQIRGLDRASTNGERIMFYIAAEQTNVQNTALLMLSSMLGYTRDYKYYDSNEPIFASVFTINHNVAKVSFSFGNPDRLIEFY